MGDEKMSLTEKNVTYKIQWQVSGPDAKSDEIILEGKSCCLGVKSYSFHQVLYLVTKSGFPSTTQVVEVFFSTCSSPDRKMMSRVGGELGQQSQVYSYEITTEWKTPLMLTVWITLKEAVEGYSVHMSDGLLTDQLWLAAKSQRFTDVEFRVGAVETKKKTFTAHRSVLAARSPVLADLLGKAGSTDSPIDVDEVQPPVFKNFLRFLYTGRLSPSSDVAGLQALADRYQVVTLQKLLRNPPQEMNASELTSLIMSLQQSARFAYPATALFGKPGQSPLLFGSESSSAMMVASPALRMPPAPNLFGVDSSAKPPARDVLNARLRSGSVPATPGSIFNFTAGSFMEKPTFPQLNLSGKTPGNNNNVTPSANGTSNAGFNFKINPPASQTAVTSSTTPSVVAFGSAGPSSSSTSVMSSTPVPSTSFVLPPIQPANQGSFMFNKPSGAALTIPETSELK